MKFALGNFFLCLMLIVSCSEKSATEPQNNPPAVFETPQVVIGKMMRGINIGNTLEPPTEGGWNNGPLEEVYFDDYKSAGFTCVRVPVRWEKHAATTAPDASDADWLDRIEQVVDWGLARDLYIILNAHHEWWLVNNYANSDTLARFESIWQQIADRFKDKSPKLLFEIINEPYGMTQAQLNELNGNILTIIRAENPQRIVIFGGHEWAGAAQLLTAAVPNDDYLMGYYHSYDPWNFAGEANGFWGTFDDIAAVKAQFSSVANWSNARNIPAMISEFGAVRNCDYNSRMMHYYTYVEQALTNGIAFMAWDDGGDFGIYDRTNRTWSEVKDILIYGHPNGPVLTEATYLGNATVYLQWQNRSSAINQIIVERKSDTSDFTEIARLGAAAIDYRDTAAGSGSQYYRVIYKFSDQPDMYSNPMVVQTP